VSTTWSNNGLILGRSDERNDLPRFVVSNDDGDHHLDVVTRPRYEHDLTQHCCVIAEVLERDLAARGR
jgi:hypothetical protein